ncbi:MAG: hypothetical protein OXF03_02240 [Gammaproteobacteria bacterium]|nr:hypothetical protein [Gammaproteobacteria bacterium]MCY4340586.1 hypothetical protein [Gammaproteobacteria bacterium]
MENVGALLAVAFVLFNLAAWLARRYRQNREQERYGHYPPAVRGGRLSYEEYKKQRGG